MTRYICKTCGAESPQGIGYAFGVAGPIPAPDPDCRAFHGSPLYSKQRRQSTPTRKA